MNINKLLEQQNITKYRLSKKSGIPHTTINDICNNRVDIKKCSAETLYKLAKALDISMESLIADAMEYRADFEIFKSNVCRLVKDIGNINFIIDTLETDKIRKLYQKKWYPESLYLLAMVDYLSRENDLPICTNYNDIRAAKLQNIIYPAGVVVRCAASGSEQPKQESIKAAIPEFIRHNIVEAEVRNVF